MGSPAAPPAGALPSTAALGPQTGSARCPHYRKGTGILPDGDFHGEADPSGGYMTFSKGQHLAPDWTVTAKTVDFIGTTFWNFDHLCSVDLDGLSAVGGIQHHGFKTVRGASYTLSFLMSGNDYCGAAIKKMKVAAGNKSVVFAWNTAHGNSAEKGKFAPRNLKFSAVGSTSALKFTSLDAAGSGCGPVIGAVAVTKG